MEPWMVDSTTPLPPTQPDADGGGGSFADTSAGHQTPAEQTAALLRAIQVRNSTIPTLTHLPPAQVAAAITIGRKKPEVRDLASWVVSTLRAIRVPDPEDAAMLDRALAALPQEASNAANQPDRLPAGLIPPGGRRPEPAPRRETYAERRDRLAREATDDAPPAATQDAQ
jgi:hypothetical protein